MENDLICPKCGCKLICHYVELKCLNCGFNVHEVSYIGKHLNELIDERMMEIYSME